MRPIDWWRLDAQERADVLAVLMGWVPQLVRRYALPEQVVPPCWYRHEAILQELLALYQYRDQQQYTQMAPPGGGHDFHYQFDLTRRRLRDWTAAAGCTLNEHIPDLIPGWADPKRDTHALWETDALAAVRESTGRTLEVITAPSGQKTYLTPKSKP